METDLFGLAGLILILVAWSPGILDTIRTKEPGMKKRFMLLYFFGSTCLSYYAFLLNSVPFLILNGLAALVPIVHFYYYVRKHGHQKILVPTPEGAIKK